MITLSNANNTNEYMDHCIRYAISLMDNITQSAISNLSTIMVNYQAELLSKISLYNSNIRLLLNNVAKVELDCYAENLIMDMEEIRNIQTNVLVVSTLQPLLSTMKANIEILKQKVELENNLIPGTLSLYSPDPAYLLQTNLFFKYKEGKNTYTNTSKVLSYLSDTQSVVTSQEQSEEHTFVDRVVMRFEALVNMIQNYITEVNYSEEIIDACKIAYYVFLEYNFVNQAEIDSFLNRNYSIIKGDVLTAVINNL